MNQKEIYICEVDDNEYCVSFNFDCDYDDGYEERYVDAEAFAEEVKAMYPDAVIVKEAA